MSLFRLLAVSAAIAAVIASRPARADVTIVATTSISMPGLFSHLPPAVVEAMKKAGTNMLDGTPRQVTMNVHGKKTRVDMGAQIILTDSEAKTTTMLDKSNRTATEMSYVDINDPKRLVEYLKGEDVTIKVTSEMKMIMGHVCRHYTVVETNHDTGSVDANLGIWAAPDIPLVPEMIAMNGPASTAQAVAWSKVKGTPLVTAMTSVSPKFGTLTFRMEVKSISQQPLEDSLFTVPPDYKHMSAPTMPAGSFPIGHGPAQ